MADIITLGVDHTSRAIRNMLDEYPELLEDEELRADSLEAETDIKVVVSKLIRAQRLEIADINGLEAYLEELGLRKARKQRKADALKGCVRKLMTAAQLPTLSLPEATISVVRGRDTVSITDIDALPQGTFSLERKPDKAAIKRLIEAGEDVPGAALVTGENTIIVRQK